MPEQPQPERSTRDRRANRESLATRLERERKRLFVGRDAELERFRRILDGRGGPTRLVVLSGPAGIGKTLLADRLLSLARAYPVPAVGLDMQKIAEPTPDSLEAAISQRLGEALVPDASMNVLCLDNIEHIAAMEEWLRLRLPALLPANTLLVLAGRWRPPTAWLADAALASALEHWPLKPLSDREMARYLRQRGLNSAQQTTVIEFAHGYPLAVALATDHLLRNNEQTLKPDNSGDLIQRLVDWLLENVRNTAYQDGLEVAASLRTVNEPVLRAMLPDADAGTLYQWLTDQPYMEHRETGLSMHELVRAVIIEDLRRRDLPRHHRLIRRAMAYFMSEIERLGPAGLHATVSEWAYATRWEPYMRRYYDMAPRNHYLDQARSGDKPRLTDIIEQQEGADAGYWFSYWYDRQPAVLDVVRDDAGRPAGVLMGLVFEGRDVHHRHPDPAVQQYLDYFQSETSLAASDRVFLARFILAADGYQQTTPVFSLLEMKVNSLAFLPGLAYFAVVCDRSKDWQGSADYANFRALPGTEFDTERRALVIRGVDLKAEPPLVWIRNTVERMLGPPGEQPDGVTGRAMTRHEFGRCVLEALRRFNDDRALATNPLLDSHLLTHCDAEGPAGVDALRRLIRETVETLDAGLSRKHLREILETSYLCKEGKQITAAAALNISESTYRRRLREAENRLTERLWIRETQTGRSGNGTME